MEQDDQHSLLLTRNFFLLHVHGTVEDVAFPGEDYDHLYCKVLFRCGPDWALVGEQQLQPQQASSSSKQSTTVGKHSHVPSMFISQTAVKGDDDGRPSACHQPLFVWNLPLEATFQSTNVFGWPQVVGKTFRLHLLLLLMAAVKRWSFFSLPPPLPFDGS